MSDIYPIFIAPTITWVSSGFSADPYSYLLDRLQSVLNSAARLVLNIAKFSGISAAIRDELHWLPIRKAIEFKIVLLVRTLPGRRCTGVLDGTVSSCQFSRRSTKPPVCFQRRPHHSSFRLRTFGFRAFAISGPQLWNSLPLTLDNLVTI